MRLAFRGDTETLISSVFLYDMAATIGSKVYIITISSALTHDTWRRILAEVSIKPS